MRAVIQGIEVEGTPQEIAQFIETLGIAGKAGAELAVAPSNTDSAASEDEEGITADFAYRTLRRLPLSQMQKSLLLSLRHTYPEWVCASAIQSEMGWTGTQFGGVLGGLGRRLTATKGYKAGYLLWQWKWNDDEGEYTYRLSDGVVAAIDRMEL